MIQLFNKTHSKISNIIVAFNAGSRMERKGDFNSGISHMLEHCIFKGTDKRSALQIQKEVSMMGGHINAFTSHEEVVYYIELPYDNLEKGMELISDIVLNSNIDDDEFKKEKSVVIEEEASSYDDVDGIMYREFSKNFYTNYLRNPVIGTKESIEKFTADEVRSFYKKHCDNRQIVVSVSSNCTKKYANSLMRKYFGKPNGKIKKSYKFKNNEKYSSLGDMITVEKPGIEHSYVWMAFPGLTQSSSGRPAMSIMSSILGGGMDSRLFNEVREKRGLAYSIYCTDIQFQTAGVFKVCFSCNNENVDEVIEIVRQEIGKIVSGDITESEIQRAKSVKRTAYYRTLESGFSMAMLNINNKVFGALSVDEYDKQLQEATLEDIEKCAKNIFSEAPFIIVCRGDQ